MDLNKLKFDNNGLIPAVVQDACTKQVLTVAYMNRESLDITLAEQRTCFYSRSRKELWRKGETSGNTQQLVRLYADCDCDALVAEVIPAGPACHTGEISCFFNSIFEAEQLPFSVDGLYELIKGRKNEKTEGSYTSYLFEKGIDKILKKVGEESAEVIIAGKDNDKREIIFEISDLFYHLLVLMVETGITPDDIKAELASRHVVDKKVKQEKLK